RRGLHLVDIRVRRSGHYHGTQRQRLFRAWRNLYFEDNTTVNSQSKPIRPPYCRDDSSKTAKVDPADYAQKFSAFLEMVTTQATGESGAIDGVLIVHPSVLGDTYTDGWTMSTPSMALDSPVCAGRHLRGDAAIAQLAGRSRSHIGD